MPEYFDISFITEKSDSSKYEMKISLELMRLVEGENITDLFSNQAIIITFIDHEDADFEELSIGIQGIEFHKETFEQELDELTCFINIFFNCNPHIQYALCSYELNGYLLGGVKKMKKINKLHFLKRFPLVYERKNIYEVPVLYVNREAQYLF